MDRLKTLRNVAIVALIAAAVEFLPGGGRAAEAFAAALWVVFAAGFAYFAYRLYRERHIDLYGLGDRHRALLYGALAVGFLVAAARPRMWLTSFGEFVWFVLVGLTVYTLLAVYRYSRSY
jgi:Mn2+/Fe2+ NRAMP family transporter